MYAALEKGQRATAVVKNKGDRRCELGDGGARGLIPTSSIVLLLINHANWVGNVSALCNVMQYQGNPPFANHKSPRLSSVVSIITFQRLPRCRC